MSYLGRKWYVLMWKNLIVRKRSWFLTLFEIVIPVLLFFMIAWLRQNHIFSQKPRDVPATINNVVTEKEIDDYSFLHHDKVHLAFSPDTPFSRLIIEEFNKTLGEIMVNGSKLESLEMFDSELKLEQYFYQKFENSSAFTNVVGYGVVFDDSIELSSIPDNGIPIDFKYKIRSTIPFWNNKFTFPQFLPAGPNGETDIYFDKGFLAFQMAIDNAYIKVAQGESAPPAYSRSLQKFPFPEYQTDIFSELFKIFMPLLTILSFITITISVLKKVVEEKVSGVTELMKMMGLQTWMVWAGWVLNGLMVYIITCGVITFLLCYSFDPDNGAVISHVNFTVIFMFYLLFCVASIFFCFAISAFFMKPTIAMTVGMVIWMLSHSMLQQYIGQVGTPFLVHFLLSLVPIFNICSGYIVIAAFESRDENLSWMNIFASADGGSTSSLGFVLVMFLLQMVVYYVITWYVTSIHPGPYGRAKPWYFIFEIFNKSVAKRKGMLDNFDDDEEDRYEAPSKDLKVGLKIQDLRKVFNRNFVAVDKVNLDIYENQITALLGHNGAGKTTTMSILTGMYSPTSGAVYARDYNIFDDMDRFRNSLGLCPQHDLLFPYMTALEHLMFFGMLKGMTRKLARSEGLELLRMLRLIEKKNVLADKLSGGMKRKVSLAIALIGTPQVLVLDEPTSGMDPESRREMWDLLVKLRDPRRTIIITTHFMEEADVLGDRIAIMDHGRVKCYGTSLFLKRAYGTGYQLTITKDVSSPLQRITEAIKSYVPESELKSAHSTQITYKVPQKENLNLSSMFKYIEDSKSQLGISGIGISCTTMEEVFLKVGQLCKEEKEEIDRNNSHSKEQQHIVRNTSVEALTYKKVTGLHLIFQQFITLLSKRSLFSIRRPIASIIFFGLPLILMWITIRNGTIDSSEGLMDPPLTLHLSQYGDTDVYVSGPQLYQTAYEEMVTKQGSSVSPVSTDIVEFLMKIGEENIAKYKSRVIVAANFNTTSNSATALYNGIAFHSAPISTNLISNALLRANERTKQSTITTINQPLDLVSMAGSCKQLGEINQMVTAFMWLILVPVGIKGFLMDLITFPHNERTSNAKQLQLMTGVAPSTYWFACFVWDYFLYFLSSLSVLIIISVSDAGNLFSSAEDYGVFYLILILFGLSGIFSTYIFSFLCKSSNMSGSMFTLFTLITGTIAPMVMYFILTMKDNGVFTSDLIMPIHYLLCLEPQYAFGNAIINFSYMLSEHSACKQCTTNPTIKDKCKVIEDQSYLEFASKTNRNGILQFLLFLAFDWILYFGLILLIEYGYMSQLCHWLKVQWVGKDFDKLPSGEDDDVRDERDRVDAARGLRDEQIVLTVDGLAKKFSRSFAAVQGVSFRVSAGECFGLLGVNGAGKTTTFRMLTGDERPTTGSANIMNYKLVRDRTKYLAQIGYCPQYDGINGFLTGDEVLRLFANLRGIPQKCMQPQIDEWISLLGLEEYRHRQCGNYSGGNKRKLSTAVALIGDPPLVFLDEPTTGVDPVARRNLWDVLGRCQRSGQAIVLTSHSMEECEALCTRLTIMVKGRMKCIGSNQYLKQRYGQGYTIMVKLDPKYIKQTAVDQLKQDIQSKFSSNCHLKDEHQSLLQYHLNDTSIRLSKLFSKLEQLKEAHSVIEDFMVSDTTLEQVFIAFARQM